MVASLGSMAQYLSRVCLPCEEASLALLCLEVRVLAAWRKQVESDDIYTYIHAYIYIYILDLDIYTKIHVMYLDSLCHDV